MNLKIKQMLKKQKTLILINLIKNNYQYSLMHSSYPSHSLVSIPTSSWSFSKAAKSFLALLHSPSAIHSPTY